MSKFSILFYESPSGKSPVRESLDKLNITARAKTLRTLSLLVDYGISPSNPQLRKIASTYLWELRILGKDNIRIICYKKDSRTIIVLHVFIKTK